MDLMTNINQSGNVTCCMTTMASVPGNDSNGTGPGEEGGGGAEMGPPFYMYVYVTLLNVIVFLVGVLGNVLVIQVVARTKSMRRRMNYFLVSLSIADLQVLVIGLPIALMEFFSKSRWYLGGFMCRLEPFLENTSHHCSVLTLLAIGFERYYAICHPLRETGGSRFTSPNILIPVVWVVSCVSALPFAIISNTKEEQFYDNSWHDVCFTDKKSEMAKVYLIVIFVLFLALPLLLLTGMYSAIIMTLSASTTSGGGARAGGSGSVNNSVNSSMNSINRRNVQVCRVDSDHFNNSRAVASRRQVVRMMLAVMALYFICLLPLRCFQLWITLGTTEQLMNLGFEQYLNLIYSLRFLMYANSAGNPIIYGLVSTNFRSAFRKSISCYSNRMDGYKYNTAYYNSSLHHRSFAGLNHDGVGNHHRNNTLLTKASSNKHRMDSHENLTSVVCTDQMMPLTESVVDAETRALRSTNAIQDDGDYYSARDVVVNPNYRSLKTEVFMKNHKQNGNAYV